MTFRIVVLDSNDTAADVLRRAIPNGATIFRFPQGTDGLTQLVRQLDGDSKPTHLFVQGWFGLPDDLLNRTHQLTFRRFHDVEAATMKGLLESIFLVPATAAARSSTSEAEPNFAALEDLADQMMWHGLG